MLDMEIRQRTGYLSHDHLNLVQQLGTGITVLVIHRRLLVCLSDIVNNQSGQYSVQVKQAEPDVDSLGQRPKSRPRQTKRDGTEQHRLAPVVS